MCTLPQPAASPRHVWVIAYDIRDDKRRVRVAKHLCSYGERVQHSVFESRLTSGEVALLRSELREIVDLKEDQLRFYPLCLTCEARIRRQGTATTLDADGYSII